MAETAGWLAPISSARRAPRAGSFVQMAGKPARFPWEYRSPRPANLQNGGVEGGSQDLVFSEAVFGNDGRWNASDE